MSAADPVDLARRLIAIDSVNPALVAGAAGESSIVDFCSDWLADHGFIVTRLENGAGRPSIIGVARGAGGGRSLLLNGHLDTVGVATYSGNGLVPRIENGRLYGRGAFDMKGGVAAIMVGAAAAASSALRGDVIVTLVADEEFGSLGTEEVLAAVTADAAIVAEPSGLEITTAHRGFAWFRLEIEGLAAHGSLPEQGIDAIAHAGLILRALDDLRDTLESVAPHPTLGHGTVRVSTISGGVDAATVAPSCVLTIERRFLPSETPNAVEDQLRRVIESVEGRERTTLTRLVARGGFEADPTWEISRVLTEAATEVLGAVPPTRGEPFWTDAGLILEAGIPCLILGVDGGGAHADEEWATTRSIEQLARIVERTVLEFCG